VLESREQCSRAYGVTTSSPLFQRLGIISEVSLLSCKYCCPVSSSHKRWDILEVTLNKWACVLTTTRLRLLTTLSPFFCLGYDAGRLLVPRLPLPSGRDGRYFSGLDAACIWLNVSSLPSKYNAIMGNYKSKGHLFFLWEKILVNTVPYIGKQTVKNNKKDTHVHIIIIMNIFHWLYADKIHHFSFHNGLSVQTTCEKLSLLCWLWCLRSWYDCCVPSPGPPLVFAGPGARKIAGPLVSPLNYKSRGGGLIKVGTN
jgi:hypothetical protein